MSRVLVMAVSVNRWATLARYDSNHDLCSACRLPFHLIRENEDSNNRNNDNNSISSNQPTDRGEPTIRTKRTTKWPPKQNNWINNNTNNNINNYNYNNDHLRKQEKQIMSSGCFPRNASQFLLCYYFFCSRSSSSHSFHGRLCDRPRKHYLSHSCLG